LWSLLFVVNYVPLLRTYPDQDNCIFGSVSNDRFRTYLEEARRQKLSWPAFSTDSRQLEQRLNALLREMIASSSSLDEKLATAHAILRAFGAQYLNTNGEKADDPYESALSQRQPIHFNYLVDINRIVWLQPYPRNVWIITALANPLAVRRETLEKEGALHFAAHILFFPDYPSGADRIFASTGDTCPKVPDAIIARQFEAMWK
jgi:hypothetical protein